MSEYDKNRDIDCTTKIPFDPAGVELTQKINVDYEKIIDESKKKALISSIKQEQKSTTSSLTGKSIFNRKRITDDCVKSNTILSTISSIHPLEDKLELQDIHDNYELKNQFSEGAQGIIRTAFDKSLKRDIVVKSLKVDEVEEHARKDENLFVSEARIMAQLDHPSIIPLYGLHCEVESKLHLAMKHIHGKTLQKYLQDIITLYEQEGIENFDEKLSIVTRIEYFLKICEAVDYAHCKGVIHRDLKPENIMIGNYGEVYVMDWGLACLVNPEKFSDDEHVSEVGAHSKNELIGTPCYIAPELIRGGECSPQSDIFSLGMILFEIVALEKAVPGRTVNEVLKNIVNCNFRPFKHRFLKSKLSSDLRAIVAKSICDSLSLRYKTANDMAKDLKLYLTSEETTARPDNIFRKCTRAMLNHKMITSLVILCILLCLAASTIYSLYSQNVLMNEQETREDMLAYFQHRVSQRANKMEQVFFYFNNQLVTLSYQAVQILNSKANTNIKIYTLADFQSASHPADYAYSPAYGISISLDYPVLKKAVVEKNFDDMDKRVVALSSIFKHMMFTSNPKFKHETRDYIKKIIMKKGAPLNWITLGLKNGTMFAYPGTSCYAKDYDPRTRPWYKKALTTKNNSRWSAPFRCALSSKVLMSTICSIYDKEKKFMGVAGLHIRLEYIQKYIFRNQAHGAKEYLINPKGQIILSSDFENKKAMINRKSTKLILKKFPFLEEFREAVKQQKVQFEVVKYKTKYLFALNRLPSLGYYYIQQISEKRLRKAYKNK
jgi:eukaryotic-like serine/threonine-protein kinase